MNKKHRILVGIVLMSFFIWIALATSSASSEVEIYAFDQNPAGSDEGNEWVTLHNPSNVSVDIGNGTLETANGERETIPKGTTLYPGAYYVYYLPYQWLDNEDEAIILKDSEGEEIDSTPILSDTKNDNRCWVRSDSKWVFEVREEFLKPTPEPSPSPTPFHTPTPINLSKLGESGLVITVIDGDTIDVEDVGRIRFADINTPEIDTEEGKAAKEYVKGLCYQKKVYLDIDGLYIIGKHGRIIAVVYIPYNETHYVNLNQLLLKEGYAEAKDYPNEFNPDVWIESPLEYVAMIPTPEHTLTPTPSPSPIPTLPPTTIPGFEFVFATVGVLVAVCLIRRGG